MAGTRSRSDPSSDEEVQTFLEDTGTETSGVVDGGGSLEASRSGMTTALLVVMDMSMGMERAKVFFLAFFLVSEEDARKAPAMDLTD